MRASDLFVKCLEAEWVEYVFGIPGEENLDFLDSLRTSGIKFILTRNEQTAVFMAATYGRFTGKTGVALATLGPGATNMVTGVAYAQLGGLPVLVITGQKPIKHSKQGQFQIIDVVGMMRPITKSATSIISGVRIPVRVRDAFKIAEEERPGAVHIELPEDIAAEETEGAPIAFQKVRRPEVETKAFEQLVQKLQNAKRPVFLVASGANRKRVSNYLTEVITKFDIPFFTSQMGKGVVDERLPQYIGTAALTSWDLVHDIVAKSDLIIAIGHDAIEKPTHLIENGETEVIHVNYTTARIDEVYAPSLEIVGDLGNLFWRLSETRLDTSKWDFSEMYALRKQHITLMQSATQWMLSQQIMGPQRMISLLRKHLDDRDILALDNGWYKIWIARNYPAYAPNTVLLDNALATMGAGLSIAMTAKILNPDQNVVCIVGDGGLVMNLWDLETAVRINLDMIVIVINNSSYGMIAIKQQMAGLPNYGLELKNPNFVMLAESFGARGFRVDKADDFETIFAQTLTMKGVKIIDLAFEYPIGVREKV